jgi:hypothetical protein
VQDTFVDGTFYTYPQQFYQVFAVLARIGTDTTPRLFAIGLLPGKDQGSSYDTFHNLLKTVCNGQLNPRRAMCDFELAISKSIKQSWPTCKVGVCINYFLYKAQVTHCWVHFRRSGRRWLGANGMLSLLDDKTTLYSTGTHGGNTFSTWVLCVYALAYVPADCVVNVFESVEWPQVLADFITDYFEGEIELFNC